MPLYDKETKIFSKNLLEDFNANGRILINLYVHEMLGTYPRGYVDLKEETYLELGTVTHSVRSLLRENKLFVEVYGIGTKPRKFRLSKTGIGEVEGFAKDRDILHKYLKGKLVGLNEVEERVVDAINKLQNLLKRL